MRIESRVVGPVQTNCYVVSDDAGCLVVDPGAEPKAILDMLAGRTPDLIVLTHRHHDHIGALTALVTETGAPVAAHELDASVLTDPDANLPHLPGYRDNSVAAARELHEGDVLSVGGMDFIVLHTPGHTPGCICLYEQAEGVLFSGDTLFYAACGRTDFPTGSPEAMRASLHRLSALPDEVEVYPGHGRATTIAAERASGLLC